VQQNRQKLIRVILPAGIFLLLLLLFVPFILGSREQKPMQYIIAAPFPEDVSIESVLSGKFQDDFGEWMRNSFWGRTAGERLKNQIVYSVFRDSSEGFSQGKDGYLFYKEFLESSVGVPDSISVSKVVTDYDLYASEVKELQDHLKQDGKDFVLILNPNKYQIYPDKLPWYQKILLKKNLTYATEEQKLIQALDRYKVSYYETANELKDMRAENRFPVFCNTGFHWSLAASAGAMHNILETLNTDDSFHKYKNIEVTRLAERDNETDKDVINAFQLPFSYIGDRYVQPEIEYSCNDLNAFLFGTSFGHQISGVLYENETRKAFRQLTFMMYFTGRYTYNETGQTQTAYPEGTAPEEMAIFQNVKESDLVMLEHQYWVPLAQLNFVQYINACYSKGGAE